MFHTIYMFDPQSPDDPVRRTGAQSPHQAAAIATRWRESPLAISNGYTVVVEPASVPFAVRPS